MSKCNNRNAYLTRTIKSRSRVYLNKIIYIYTQVYTGIYQQVCCLLAGLNLWQNMLLKCSSPMVFTFLLVRSKISFFFWENNNNGIVFPFPFYIFMLIANLWFIRLQGQFSTLRTRKCPDVYPLIRPPRRLFSLFRRILVPEFIRSPPM